MVSDASRDISFLTTHSPVWKEKAASFDFTDPTGSMAASLYAASQPRVSTAVAAAMGEYIVSARPVELVEQPVDESAPHDWYRTVFNTHMPAGRRDALLVAKWLDKIDAMGRVVNEEPATSASAAAAGTELTDISAVENHAHTRERVERYSAAFEELVRQVSVGCIERGQAFTHIWHRLNGAMEEFQDTEDTLRRELGKYKRRHELEKKKASRRLERIGELEAQLSSLSVNARWERASIRIRRYQDTVKWRMALSMLAREKEKLVKQLGELRKSNVGLHFRAVLKAAAAAPPKPTPPPPPPPDDMVEEEEELEPASKKEPPPALRQSELNTIISDSLRTLPNNQADTRES